MFSKTRTLRTYKPDSTLSDFHSFQHAEGHSRASSKEFLHYISIALGSAAELETQLMLAGRLKYVGQNDTQCAIAQLEDIGKMLRGLQKSLKSKLHSSP